MALHVDVLGENQNRIRFPTWSADELYPAAEVKRVCNFCLIVHYVLRN